MQPDNVTQTPLKSHRGLSRGQAIFLIGLVLLVIAGSVGLFYVVRTNQIASSNANATATARANSTATTVSAQATGIAETNALLTQNAVTEANATATATASAATAIASASPIPYGSYRGVLVLNDSLSNAWGGSANTSPGFSYCVNAGGALHDRAPTGVGIYCYAPNTDFADFAYEVHMTIVEGGAGGIIFRSSSTSTAFYQFLIGVADGRYLLIDPSGKTLSSGSSSAINTGPNQSNLIAVVAQGSKIEMYVNRQLIASVNDSTFMHGGIGVAAVGTTSTPTEAVFSDAKVWMLV